MKHTQSFVNCTLCHDLLVLLILMFSLRLSSFLCTGGDHVTHFDQWNMSGSNVVAVKGSGQVSSVPPLSPSSLQLEGQALCWQKHRMEKVRIPESLCGEEPSKRATMPTSDPWSKWEINFLKKKDVWIVQKLMMNTGRLNASSSFSCTYSSDLFRCYPSPIRLREGDPSSWSRRKSLLVIFCPFPLPGIDLGWTWDQIVKLLGGLWKGFLVPKKEQQIEMFPFWLEIRSWGEG